jgi:hypothetical protein
MFKSGDFLAGERLFGPGGAVARAPKAERRVADTLFPAFVATWPRLSQEYGRASLGGPLTAFDLYLSGWLTTGENSLEASVAGTLREPEPMLTAPPS